MTDKEKVEAPKVEETKVKLPKAPQPVVVQQPPEKREASIYIGPSLQGGSLVRNTLFKGGVLPAHVQELADKHRSVIQLIVPVSKLAEYEKRLADKTSVEAARFEEAKTISEGEQ